MQELSCHIDGHLWVAHALCSLVAGHNKGHCERVVQKLDRCTMWTSNRRLRTWYYRAQVRVWAKEICGGTAWIWESHQADFFAQTWEESQENTRLKSGLNCGTVLWLPKANVDYGKGAESTLLAWEYRLHEHTWRVVEKVSWRLPLKEEVPTVKFGKWRELGSRQGANKRSRSHE